MRPSPGPSPMASESSGRTEKYYPSAHIILADRPLPSLPVPEPLCVSTGAERLFFGPGLTGFTATKQKGERLA